MKNIRLSRSVEFALNGEERLSQRERSRITQINRYGIGCRCVIRITQVPGEVVNVAEDMAARARGLTVSRELSVIQERSSLDHGRRLRIGQSHLLDLLVCGQIDDLQRIVKARLYIKFVSRLV